MRHGKNGTDQGLVFDLVDYAGNEALVDLQRTGTKVLEVAQ